MEYIILLIGIILLSSIILSINFILYATNKTRYIDELNNQKERV